MIERTENIIRREIEFMFGRRIVSSGDCIQLSEEIFRITKSRLNPNTLRRFFGLVKTIYSPSASTMQILCNYCGFSSLEEVKSYPGLAKFSSDTPEQKNLLNFLVNLYSETPVENEKNETFKSVVKQTIIFLNQQPELVDKFQSMIARTKNGQDYYFEGLSHIDKLNSSFGNGLRYFLNERLDKEAQVFGHSLLVFRYWLTEDQPNMEKHFHEIRDVVFNPSLSYNTSGRYFASLLYHADALNYTSSDILNSIHTYYMDVEVDDGAARVNFELIIAEALVLTRNFEEGLHYVDIALKKIQGAECHDESIIQNLYLIRALALFKQGDIKNAEHDYRLIRPTLFNFLNKKLQTILYSFLTEKLKKNIESFDNQQLVLINDTGFCKLQQLVHTREYII